MVAQKNKEMLKSIYKSSGKYSLVYGISFILILIIALFKKDNNLNIIEKLNTTGQMWKVFLGFFIFFSILYFIDKILNKISKNIKKL